MKTEEDTLTVGISRRKALGIAVGGLAAPGLFAATNGPNSSEPFLHGVASGDPQAHSVVIWTRIEAVQDLVAVQWEIAEDKAFLSVVRAGTVTTNFHRDHTVKVLVNDLQAGRIYYYRFSLGQNLSMVGRTRTLPVSHIEKVSLAVVSCSNYPFGFFNAYEVIAEDPGIDFVLHLGDYLYEYGADEWGGDVGRRIGRIHEPRHEIVNLADYRQRHAQYKRDPQSQLMHAQHPLMVMWDDHESANNPWIGGAQNHQSESEGLWLDRRQASLRAYYEWMPIREPGIGGSRADYWGVYSFGDLATLVTLETRHTARAQQIDYADYLSSIDSKTSAQAFVEKQLGRPNRRMLSTAMEEKLAEALTHSIDAQQAWRLIGNPIPMAKMPVPDVSDITHIDLDVVEEVSTVTGALLTWKGRWSLPFYLDTWDGYPWAREAFYAQCRSLGASDLVVLSGDSHSFWANQLFDAQGRSVGVEVGTAGITSPGDFVESGFSQEIAHQLDQRFMQKVEEVRWTDNLHQGYVRLKLTHTQIEADYVAVDTVITRSSTNKVIHKEVIVKNADGVAYLT